MDDGWIIHHPAMEMEESMRRSTLCILQIEFGITPRVLPVVSQPHQLLEEWEEGPGKDKLRKASMLRILLLLPSGGFSLVQFSSGFVPWDSDKDDKDLHSCTYLHTFSLPCKSTEHTLYIATAAVHTLQDKY